MISPFLRVLVAAPLLCYPTMAWGDQVAAALERVAGKIQQSSEVRGKKVGVGDFSLTDGRVTELGAHLADQLEVAITARASSGAFEVVARSQLCQVIRENKLWLGDQFDPALQKKLGRLGQADLLATGRITDRVQQFSVSIRVLDTETGKAVWADSMTLAADEGLRGLLTRPIVGDGCGETSQSASATSPAPLATPPPPPGLALPPDRLQVKIWSDKPRYRIGEQIQFGLRVDRDAYVTLINIGTSGEVTIIYPNRFHPNHFIRGGQDVTIPPADSGFNLVVQGPTGFDQVRAIATEDPVKFHPGGFAGQKTTFRSLDRVQTRGLAVEIKEERAKVAPTRWAEEVIAIQVVR